MSNKKWRDRITERSTRDVVKRDERWEFASDNERGKNTEVTTGASERCATECKKRADDEGPEEEGRVKSKEIVGNSWTVFKVILGHK